MAVLLIAEHNNKELRPFTLNAATAASQIDADVHAVIIGQNSETAAKKLSELPPVKKVISIEAPHYENFTAENFAPAIVKLAGNYSHIVCSKNTFGKNLMPRIAAHLDTSQVSDIIKVISPASPFSIIAVPPELSHGSKDVGLIVIHFLASLVFTVAKAFPA